MTSRAPNVLFSLRCSAYKLHMSVWCDQESYATHLASFLAASAPSWQEHSSSSASCLAHFLAFLASIQHKIHVSADPFYTQWQVQFCKKGVATHRENGDHKTDRQGEKQG